MENRRYEVSIIESSRSEGKLEGIEEGKQRATINIARVLKQQGTELDAIAQATGLSKEEIEKL